MLITLEIDLNNLSEPKGEELGRILRYWGGNAKALDLSAPTEMPLMDSAYQEVGTLKIE